MRSSAALLLFNLLDGLFTVSFLHLGWATELNPLMRWAYSGSPATFLVVKMVAVGAGLAILWSHRQARPARIALHAAAGIYAAIVLYHLAFLLHAYRPWG